MILTKPELAEIVLKALDSSSPMPTGEDDGWAHQYPLTVFRIVEAIWDERVKEVEEELEYLTWNGAS